MRRETSHHSEAVSAKQNRFMSMQPEAECECPLNRRRGGKEHAAGGGMRMPEQEEDEKQWLKI